MPCSPNVEQVESWADEGRNTRTYLWQQSPIIGINSVDMSERVKQVTGHKFTNGQIREAFCLCNNLKVSSSCLTKWGFHHDKVWGSGNTDPHSLHLCTRWKWVVSFTSLPLQAGPENPPIPFGCEAGWTKESVCKMWKSENSFYYRDPNSDPLVVQPVASP
jgi:hypothetical protein